jgi:malate dehydrogenase
VQAGKGSATLSMAYAAAAFAESCLRAMAGESGVTEYAYVESSVVEGVPFFASQVQPQLLSLLLAFEELG